MTRVLVVDDEPQIRRALAINLGARDYDVTLAATGTDALKLAADKKPDIVLLDIGLPDIDGIDVVRGLRGWTEIPIIMLTVRSEETDKVDALDAGADDYVTKPFGMNELLARMRAALRRTAPPDDEEAFIVAGDLEIDLVDKRIRRNGTDVHLTPIEWGLVEHLARNRDRLVAQRQILQAVWGPHFETEINYLRVHMGNVRHKLEVDPSRPRHFITEPGMGYRFVTTPLDGPEG
jgi:two-component system, OmpR family, KDP operon response regulator KdpE